MEGGKIAEGDQAQVAEVFDCQDALDLIVFSSWALGRH